MLTNSRGYSGLLSQISSMLKTYIILSNMFYESKGKLSCKVNMRLFNLHIQTIKLAVESSVATIFFVLWANRFLIPRLTEIQFCRETISYPSENTFFCIVSQQQKTLCLMKGISACHITFGPQNLEWNNSGMFYSLWNCLNHTCYKLRVQEYGYKMNLHKAIAK